MRPSTSYDSDGCSPLTITVCFRSPNFIQHRRTESPDIVDLSKFTGDPGYPTNEQWAVLNATVLGRLVNIVPFVEFCNSQGGCTAEQSASSSFRSGVPGEMDGVRSLPFRFLASIEADTWFVAKLGTGWTHSCPSMLRFNVC